MAKSHGKKGTKNTQIRKGNNKVTKTVPLWYETSANPGPPKPAEGGIHGISPSFLGPKGINLLQL